MWSSGGAGMSGAFPLPSRLVVQDAGELHARLCAAAGRARTRLHLDGHAVEDIDGAGLQLLLAAQREAERRQLAFRIERASEALQRTLAMTGLTTRLLGTETERPRER